MFLPASEHHLYVVLPSLQRGPLDLPPHQPVLEHLDDTSDPQRVRSPRKKPLGDRLTFTV